MSYIKKIVPFIVISAVAVIAGYKLRDINTPQITTDSDRDPSLAQIANVNANAPAPIEKLNINSDPRAFVMSINRNVSIGTVLKAEDFTWKEWPADLVQPDYILQSKDANAPTTFTGAVVRSDMMKDEPLNTNKVIKAGEKGSLALMVSPGMRAFTIPISSTAAVSGFILPGDRVDIMLSQRLPAPSASSAVGADGKKTPVYNPAYTLNFMRYLSQKRPDLFARLPEKNFDAVDFTRDPGARPDPYGPVAEAMNKQIWSFSADEGGGGVSYVETIMSNVKILAIDQKTHRPSGGGGEEDNENNANGNRNRNNNGGGGGVIPSMSGGSATIEVFPEQAELLTLAQEKGKLTLSLRGITDSQLANTVGDNLPKVSGFFGRFMPGQIDPKEASAEPDVVEKPAETGKIKILRSDVLSDVSLPETSAAPSKTKAKAPVNTTNIPLGSVQRLEDTAVEKTMFNMLRTMGPTAPNDVTPVKPIIANKAMTDGIRPSIPYNHNIVPYVPVAPSGYANPSSGMPTNYYGNNNNYDNNANYNNNKYDNNSNYGNSYPTGGEK